MKRNESPTTHHGSRIPHSAFRVPHPIRLLLAGFILLAATYSVVVPPFETPDEIWHMAFVQYVATGQGLPVSEPNTQALWRQQGVQAPGYYLAAAALTAFVDQSDFPAIYARANPHRTIGHPDAPTNRNYLIHYPDAERFPWHGSILALHIARFFSVLLGAVTVYATYRTLDLLLDRTGALLGAAFVAAIPQFLFISGAASNDNAINATAALVLWQLVALVVGGGGRGAGGKGHLDAPQSPIPDPRSPFISSPVHAPPSPPLPHSPAPHLLPLGLFLGLALISKLSALALVGLAGLVGLWLAWRERSWRLIGRAVLWVGAPLLLIAGWWYARNWWLYGDPLAWNVWQQNILLRVVPADWRTIAGELESLERSFWGLFGWMNVGYPEWVYTLLRALELLVLAGILAWLVRRARQIDLRDARLWAGLLLILWLLLLTISWLRFMRIAPAAQGRYFFPAAPALALLFVLAWRGFGRRLGTWLGGTIVAGLAILALVTPFWIIRPVYAAPPAQRAETQPALAIFGGDGKQVALVAFAAEPDRLLPGQTATVRVAWQARSELARDYSVFVHLVDRDGFIVAQQDTMPGGGRLPTSRWQPGQLIEDRYAVTVPVTAYVPNQATWAIGLYEHATGAQMPLLNQDGVAFRSGDVTIAVPASSAGHRVPNPTDVQFADGISLVGYRLSQRSLAPGETVTVTLYWQARAAVSKDYTTFVHLLDMGYAMHGGHDGAPPAATSTWRPGDVIEDSHSFVVDPDAAPGEYQLEIGLYPWPDFSRLRRLDATGAEGADRLLLGPLRVVLQ